jgi:branched-chain amino acid transport system permease protein
MADFVQTLVSSITVGSLYALIALGYTMVYGILRFINFAHGDMVVLGAWFSFVIANRLGYTGKEIPWYGGIVVLTAAAVLCGIVGLVIERFAYRPLRRSARINILITAIGVSLLMQNVGILPWAFGPSPKAMPQLWPNFNVIVIPFGERQVTIGLVDVLTMVTSAALMIGLQYLVFRTKIGRAMRAIAFNPDTAALMGIPVDRVVSITFVLGSALAAAAGFLFVMKYPGALNQPSDPAWVLLGLKAFVAAVVGGIGSVRGAVIGGFVIAFVEQFGRFYISSNYSDVYVFGLLILILLVKPTGILGSTLREKV